MNIFQKADYFLISRIFQPIVDWSQKKPLWWMLQLAHFTTIVFIMRASARFPDRGVINVFTIGGVLMMIVFYATARSSRGQQIVAESFLTRMLFLFSALIDVTTLILLAPTFIYVSDMVYSLGIVSYTYFSCCKPPKPKVPRTKLAYQ